MKKLAIIAIALIALMSILIATPVYADAQEYQASEETVVANNMTDRFSPLTYFQGKWYGKGWNLVVLPIEKEPSSTDTQCVLETGKGNFCIKTAPYCEILEFDKSFKITNKLFPENIVVDALPYVQKVFLFDSWKPGDPLPECSRDAEEMKVFHGEDGTLLFLGKEGTTDKVARIFSLPNGVMVLAMGKGELQDLQEIKKTGGLPVAELENREVYNKPYDRLEDELGDFFSAINPNDVLDKEVIKGDAMVLELSTDNSGGAIVTVPYLNQPSDAVGAFQMPKFKSTFWIENINEKKNLQLQYSQTIDFEFIKDVSGNLILWPHVDVATLCKDDYCSK